jgi:lysophospholipase L1-like esterase
MRINGSLLMTRSTLLPLVVLLAGLGGAVVAGSPAQAAVQTATLRLEPLGDSITYGTSSSTGNGYRQMLWNELTGEGHQLDFVGSVKAGPMSDPDNEGHPGLRIDEIANLTDSSLATYKPNVITLMAGTNDMVQNFQVSTAPTRLSSLIDKIVADDPRATVLVANLVIGTNANIAALEPAYNATIPGIVSSKQSAGKHVAFVNMSALTAADLAPDGIHPVDSGYQKMADAFNAGIQTAASNGWISAPVANGGPTAGQASAVSSGVTGKCLDVSGGNTANGTHVQIWTCNRTAPQSWTQYSDGSLRALGKCLDASAAGTANGTPADLWDCNGSGAQVWQAYNGGYRNMVSGRCLDDPAGSTSDGTQLVLWDCNGAANQKWTPHAPGPVTSGVAGKCLDDKAGAGTNGTAVDVWDCNGSAAQAWNVNNAANLTSGTVQINGKCLDITGGGTANGTLVELWDCTGGTNQVWNPVNGTLVNPASGRCLDDPGASTVNGTQVVIWDCNGGANQKWTPSA